MIRPPPLRPGDLVRVVAPSGPIDPGVLDRGVSVLRQAFGVRVRFRADVVARDGYLAGGDERRAAEWREAVSDPEARAIFCARGGYGALRILPQVDPAPLLRDPKWVVGFSDATVLHALLNAAGLVTVHGPMVSTLAGATPETLEQLRAVLFGAAAGAPPPGLLRGGTGCEAASVIRPGTASGPLRGGSLTLLAHLAGTPWQPRLSGAVLFLEDVDEKPYRLDRYLAQLRLCGALEGVRGVCVGRLTGCDDADQRGADTVRAIVGALGVPAVEGIAAGHEEPNLALLLGAQATLIAPAPGEPGPPRLLFDAGGALA